MPSDVFGLAGHVIDGQFAVVEAIGEGGFSVVYRGQHLSLREPVAIKCLKLLQGNDPQVIASFTQRFFDESRIAYRLSKGNLNIVRSITSGSALSPRTGDAVPYMVLEWLEGTSLAADFRARREAHMTGRSFPEVLDLFDPAVAALAYAHSQGILHRDIKPGNLFLAKTPDGPRLKVLDFGMAKIMSPEVVGFPGTPTLGGLMVMSPHHSAPEQFDRKYGPPGTYTDVYSLALVLSEALADRRARTTDNLTELLLTVGDPNRRPTPRALGARISDDVEALFASALSVDPLQRPNDVQGFWSRLKTYASRQDVVAPQYERTLAMHQVLPEHVRAYLADARGAPLQRGGLSTTVPLPASKPHAAAVVASASSRDAPPMFRPAGPAPALTSLPLASLAVAPSVQVASGSAVSRVSAPVGGGTRPRALLVVAAVFSLLVVGLVGLSLLYLRHQRRTLGAVPSIPVSVPHPDTSSASGEATPRGSPSTPVTLLDAAVSASQDILPPGLPSPSSPADVPLEAGATAVAPASTALAVDSVHHPPPQPRDPSIAKAAEANVALSVVDGILASCKRNGGPTGKGTARVSFNFDGTVAQVIVDRPPYGGTPTASCIASRYRTARVRPFEGAPLTVEHGFDITQ